MSLKALHIVFITASVLMSFGVAAWGVHAYQQGGSIWNLVLGAGAGVAGAGLLIYGRYFLKKLKHISYL